MAKRLVDPLVARSPATSPAIAYLDTHVVVWLAAGKVSRISPKAKAQLERSELLISPVVLLELEYVHELKRVKLPARDLFQKVAHEVGVRLCDLSFASIVASSLDEKWTRDPFDRLIVANAKASGFAPLVSADEEIRRRYPRTIW
jgi:PIN domain nuclease of toxin-antitoxin system